MRRAGRLALVLALAPLAARAAAPTAPPAWSFAAPLGGFDLGAAQRGLVVYEARCASCHGMASLAPVDLLGLGLDRHAIRLFLRGLGHPPFTAGDGAPDLSRTVKARPGGADGVWTLLRKGAGAPPGHPVLAADGTARDVVTFLAWAAEPHLTARRRTGVAVLLFGAALLAAARFAIRRKRHA